MTRTDDILNQIDTALEDGTVSYDAMRSRPAPVPAAASGPRLWIAPVGTAEDGDGWEEIGHVTDIEFTIDPAATTSVAPTVTWSDIQEYFARIQAERIRRAQVIVDAFVQAMSAAIAPAAARACRDLAETAEAFQHLPEAAGCNDCGKPIPPRDRPAWQSPYGPPQRRR
ncbi:hypothetical protein [Streptomyces sp. NPDC058268]|uniref:hypothetical protein n=1 Tax=Streptomyces sp. NPDC058268 TaxID=3346413 RepID=UPI0036EA3E70